MDSENIAGVSRIEALPSIDEVMQVPHKERSPIQKRVAYMEALKAYMQGWPGHPSPSVFEVAEKFLIPLKTLEKHSISADWAATRANYQISEERSLAASRLAVVLRVDKTVIEQAEKVIAKAADHYMKLLDTVTAMPEGQAPRETSAGSPVKSEIETKIYLLTRLSAGFIAMAQGAKQLGLVKAPGEDDRNRGVLDPAKLAGLSLTIIQQDENGRMKVAQRPASEVLDIEADRLPLAGQVAEVKAG